MDPRHKYVITYVILEEFFNNLEIPKQFDACRLLVETTFKILFKYNTIYGTLTFYCCKNEKLRFIRLKMAKDQLTTPKSTVALVSFYYWWLDI